MKPNFNNLYIRALVSMAAAAQEREGGVYSPELGSIVGRDSRLWENSLLLSGFH